MRLLQMLIFATLYASASVESLRTPYRSVRKCDSLEKTFLAPDRLLEACKLHCWQTYVGIRSDIIAANRGLFQFELKPFGNLSSQTPGQELCCCYYNHPWRKDFVKMEYVNRRSEDWNVMISRTECLPIAIRINLSKRTIDNYKQLCQLLNKKEPLTMLELVKFVDSAAYLNYMQPKHLSIWKTLKAKEVKKIDAVAANEIHAVFNERLLDEDKPLEDYGGSKLDTARLIEFMETKKSIAKAIGSHVVAIAFDELVISHALIDIAAASNNISFFNDQKLDIPQRLLLGHYDKYDHSSHYNEFRKNNLNCELLRVVDARLRSYLSAMKSLLSSLYDKLVFEVMCEKYHSMIYLKNSQDVYGKLLEVNCGNTNITWPELA